MARPTMVWKGKQGDTGRDLEAQLLDAKGRPVPINDGDTVWFRMRPQVAGLTDAVDHRAVVVDPDEGIVASNWQPGDIDTPGLYFAEFYVLQLLGSQVTFPSDGYITVEVESNASGRTRELDYISVRVN